jgi:hypothetical protein
MLHIAVAPSAHPAFTGCPGTPGDLPYHVTAAYRRLVPPNNEMGTGRSSSLADTYNQH